MGQTRLSLAILATSVIASCGQFEPPQIFTFEYRAAPTSEQIITNVKAGSESISRVLGPSPCVMAVSFADGVKPLVSQGGVPGDANYQVTISSTTPVNFSTSSPAGCPDLTDVRVEAGGIGEALDVGTTSNATSFRVTIDGEVFSTNLSGEYFQTTLTSYAPSRLLVSGEFEAIAKGDSDSATMIVVSGAFSVY